MHIPLCDLKRQLEPYKQEYLTAIESVLESGQFILGPEVAAFEAEAAAYLAVPYAFGVASGTDALWLALKALDIRPGDRVLTTPVTFFATASAIVNAGAEPVFADVNPHSLNLCPDSVRQVLEGRSEVCRRLSIDPGTIRALMPVHLYGQPADMAEFRQIAVDFGLSLIEDTAQAMGASYRGVQAGTVGEVGCFSFFPTKNLGGFGDGGMTVTRDSDLAERLRRLRTHGSPRKYHHELIGTNSRLDTLQACILRIRLRRLDEMIESRRRIAAQYRTALSDLDWMRLPEQAPDRTHTFHVFAVQVEEDWRDELSSHLAQQGIDTLVYYPVPLHLQSALQHLGYHPGDFPRAESACRSVLALPIFPGMTDQEIAFTIEGIQCFKSKFGRYRVLMKKASAS